MSISANDIPWDLKATPRLEAFPTTGAGLRDLSHPELLAYVADLREDAAALRLVLHQALGQLAAMTTLSRNLGHSVESLRAQLRRERTAA
jgi:hypothetical protein